MNELPDEDKMRTAEELVVEPEDLLTKEDDPEADPEEPVVTEDSESEALDPVSDVPASETAQEPEAEKPEDPKPKTAATKKKRKKKTAKDLAIEFLIKIVVTAAVVAVLLIFVVGIHVNHGNSSYPMIKDGDLVITYKLGKAEAGEEIAYKLDGKLKFGRIVAKGGDVVEITESYMTVNGYGVYEDVVYPTTANGAVISFPYIVPEGSVFVLNDFRPDVGDSRTYGAIPLSDLEGEVVLVLRRRGI